MNAALELGLGQKALDMLEQVDWRSFANDDPNKELGVKKELALLMQTGRAEEVGKRLVEEEQNLKDALGVDPETGLPAYEWLRVQVAAATGDYAGADHWLKAIQDKTRRAPRLFVRLQQLELIGTEPAEVADLEASALTALLAGRLVLGDAPSAAGRAVALVTASQRAIPAAGDGRRHRGTVGSPVRFGRGARLAGIGGRQYPRCS